MADDHSRLLENDWVAVKRCRHGLFAYNVNDSFIGRSLDLYGEWCEAELAILGQILRPGDTALDVGANIGTHAVFFANAVGPKGVVHAIEPQRIAYQLLCANAVLNGLLNIHCRHAAAGAEAGQATVPVLDPRAEQNFGALAAGRFDEGEPVAVITVDSLDLARCRLIKIDVEGAEAAVLAGARETIGRHRPALFVECNRPAGSPALIEAIEGLGYTAWWHIAAYFNPDNFFANRENAFARFAPEANLLCLPADAEARLDGLIPVEGADDTWQKAVARGQGGANRSRGSPGTRSGRPSRAR